MPLKSTNNCRADLEYLPERVASQELNPLSPTPFFSGRELDRGSRFVREAKRLFDDLKSNFLE